MSELPQRQIREVDYGGVSWRAIEAWRGRGGHALCYLLRIESEQAAADDREDRRATLEPGEELTALSEDRLDALVAGAAPLTKTERRIVDAAGVPWLAQASGPVWAEGGVAAGLAGVVFTRLQGPFQRLAARDDHATAATTERLLALLERARKAAEIDRGG